MEIKEIVVQEEKRPNTMLAVLCAAGLGLLGSLLWGVLYYAGYIAWLASYLVVMAAAWGYKKINRKMDVKGYIIVTTIAVAEIVVALMISLNLAVMTLLADDGIVVSFGQCFSLMFQVLGSNQEALNALIIDVVLSIIFLIAGIITYFFIEKNGKKRVSAQENQMLEPLMQASDHKEEKKVDVNISDIKKE